MAFVVSSLTNYVDQTSTDLLVAAQFSNATAKMATIQTGVKSSAALQLLATDPIPQDGSTCGFTASGSVTFTQRTLSTTSSKFEDTLCPKALEAKWTQILLRNGQNYTEADVNKAIVDEILRTISKRLEVADWQGDTDSSDAYLKRYDGLVKTISNASGVVSATSSTFNSTNCRTIAKNLLNNIPSALRGDSEFNFAIGYDALEVYRQKLLDDNLYHVNVTNLAGNELPIEGSVHKFVAYHGLDGLNTSGKTCIFGFKWSNVFLGVDAQGEEDQIKMWLDGSDQESVKYRVKFRRGWQIAYPSEIVKYANS